MDTLFEAVDISVNFGAVKANDRVSISVPRQTLVGLIGPNGAGKTTFIDAVTGFVPSSGNVLLEGRDIAGFAPHRRARAGVTRTWQGVDLFSDLTVIENLLVASEPLSLWGALREIVAPRRGGELAERMRNRLEVMGLGDTADVLPSELSTGHRNLVGLARALAAEAPLVLLDEPAAGLDTSESAELGRRLRRMVDGGDTMLLVDHDMSLVLSICDLIYVLDFGRVIAHGTPAEIRSNRRVIDAYLGERDDDDPVAVGESSVAS